MTPRIGRRYDALTRFLKETIGNEKIGHRVRMAAALRLSDIYLEHDRSQERREIARDRTAARVAEAKANPVPEPSTPEMQAPADAERAALEFLAGLTGKEERSNDKRKQ
jgi:hypothetical protein